MRAIRAYDGRAIVVNQPLAQFPVLDDLLDCFSLATEIPSDAIICMTSDGRQLTQQLLDQIIQELPATSGVLSRSVQSDPHQEYFVFNREFLYTDPTALAAELALAPVLEPQTISSDIELRFPPTPRSLESIVSWSAQVAHHASTYEQRCRELFQHISAIAKSTHVALLNLKSHADKIEAGAKALLDDVAGKELARMNGLLDGYEKDLYILGLITIHPRLQSTPGAGSLTTPGGSSNGKPKPRTLGDYVSKTKMGAVGEACAKVYAELNDRIRQIQADLTITRQDTEGLALEVESTTPDVSQEAYQRAVEADSKAATLHAVIRETCSPDAHGWPVADKLTKAVFEQVVESFDELVVQDHVAREALQRLAQDRNDILERSLHLLIDISSLQSEFAETGALLAAVDADMHSNKVDGFKHLNRLKNMLWAYGASVVEVVRRREFAKHFLGKSQSLAELMAKLSASEWKRRQVYRADVSSLLPWEVKGMDDKPPSLEITTPRVGSDGMADLGIADLEALYQLLDQVDEKLAEDYPDGPSPIPEVKAALQRLAAALQDLGDEFIDLVHLQLLETEEDVASDEEDASGSDTSIRARKRSRRRTRIAAAKLSGEKAEQLKAELVAAKALQNRTQVTADKTMEQVSALQEEVRTLKAQVASNSLIANDLTREKEELGQQIDMHKADLEIERERRLNMVDEVSQLRRDLEESHRSEAEARQELQEEGERCHELETNLHEMQVELEEAKAARIDASNRIEALLSEGSSVESELRTAQARIDELTEQMSAAHAEASKARELTAEIESAKERQIRSHKAEADGDRAILEEKVRALKAEVDRKQEDLEALKKSMAEAEQGRLPDREAVKLLQEQLRAADITHEEIVQQMEGAKALADEAVVSRRDVEASRQLLLERSRLLLAKSCLLRKTVSAVPIHSSRHVSSSSTGKATAVPESAQRAIAASTGGLSVSEMSENGRQASLDAFEADPDTADLETTLDALWAFDAAEMYDEAKLKLDSLSGLLRKWQRAWKSSNEKTQRATAAAKDKIAFRSFQPGDLALFLPTRNSKLSAKPWAAFNISFPHFFLHVTGALADQLKTREWIVARITTMSDHVATNSPESGEDADSTKEGNPFQLAEGVRYFLLDVEPWSGTSSAPPQLRSRKSASAVTAGADVSSNGKPEIRRSESTPHKRMEDFVEDTPKDPLPRFADIPVTQSTGPQKIDSLSTFVPIESVISPVKTERESPVVPPSGLTRALRAESSNANRLETPSGRSRAGTTASAGAWSARSGDKIGSMSDAPLTGIDGENSSAGGSSSRRSIILEQATMTPAFGRGSGKSRRMTGELRARNHSPSDSAAGGRLHDDSDNGSVSRRSNLSASGSQSRSPGIAIKGSGPLDAELRKVAMTNPFSQSPGPASLIADNAGVMRERLGLRKSSLQVSTSASAGEEEEDYFSTHNIKVSVPEEEDGSHTILLEDKVDTPQKDQQPKVERWPAKHGSRSVSSSSSVGGRSASIRINGKSLVFNTDAKDDHRRQPSFSSAATTAVSTTNALPGAFPSSVSSSNGSGGAVFAVSPASDAAESLTSTHRRNSSFASATSRPTMSVNGGAPPQVSRKPSFLSQTLSRFTGALTTPPVTGSRSPVRPSGFQVHDVARNGEDNAQSTLKRLNGAKP